MTEFLHRFGVWAAPWLVQWLMRIWFCTCRLEVRGQEHLEALDQGQQIGIAAFWHYSFIYLFYYLRAYPAAVMVSASRDGEYIARLAALLGHTPVRGSSNQRGFRALREMLVLLRQGRHAAIVADGSQGPARKAQAGCIIMASKSGRCIYPIAWAAKRCIRFNSWDNTILPLPFTDIMLIHAPPLQVAAEINAGEIEEYRARLETSLNAIYEEAWHAVGKSRHDGQLRGSDGGDTDRNAEQAGPA